MHAVKNNNNNNKDLIWDLDQLQQQQRALSFVRLFEQKLCVYSASMEQLYTNYEFVFNGQQRNQLLILPDPYAYHDTFQRIKAAAVQPTGIHIIPGNLINQNGLYLLIAHKGKGVQSAPIPFQEGLRHILKRSNSNDPFLPVLIKGDLREFNNKLPSIHLNRIRLSQLSGISRLEQDGLRHCITNKLMQLYQQAKQLSIEH